MQRFGEHQSSIISTPIPAFVPGMTGTPRTPIDDSHAYVDFKVIRRNGSVVAFEPGKVSIAMTKAFLAVNGGQGAASARVRELVERLTASVVQALLRSRSAGATFHIEDIQDQVELSLMRSGEHEVARAYVLYREKRAQERAAKLKEQRETEAPAVLHVKDGALRRPLDMEQL